MMLAAVMALKAYSGVPLVHAAGKGGRICEKWLQLFGDVGGIRTDLVKATIVGEDGDVSVGSCWGTAVSDAAHAGSIQHNEPDIVAKYQTPQILLFVLNSS